MSHYWACNSGGCCVWVEATKCPGNTADYRVFVHEDDLPVSGGVFSYGGVQYEHNNCWTIDPGDPRVALPHGAHWVNPGTTYDSCSECEADVDEPPSSGGGPGGGGPGGGGPGGPGGGGPGGGIPGGGDGETCGVKLQICPEHAGLWNGPDLYVPCSAKPDSTRYVRIYGYCFEVPTGPETDPIPDGTYFVGIGGSFDDCHDCAYGKKARLCPDQDDVPGIESAPEVWVRSRDLPTSGGTAGFLWGNFCYELRASDGEQIVPIDAFILNPRSDFGGCTECKLGVQAQRCPNEADPAPGHDCEVWVEASEAEALQDVGVVYFRYRELCYSLDPSTTPSRIPFDAKKVVPKDEYLDCETCICGERSVAGDMGVKAHLCPDQSVDLAEDVWILEEDIPLEPTYFKRGGDGGGEGEGTCYYVDPADTPREIPVGSLIARIENTYENCFDCTTGGGGPPKGPGGGVDPPLPPPPWWPPLPPENFYELIDCETSVGTNKWVRENHTCALFGVVPCDIRGQVYLLTDGRCYEIGADAEEEPPGPTVTNQLVALLAGGCNGYRLTDCDGQKPDITTRDPLQGLVGRVVRLVDDDTCWAVSEEPICLNDNPQFVEIDESFVDCQECKDNPPAGGSSGDCIGCDQV